MTKDELFNALDGLYAFDKGCVSSGIHDELLRAETRDFLRREARMHDPGHPVDRATRLLTEFVREHYLTDAAMLQGYSLAEAAGFVRWLSERMEFDI